MILDDCRLGILTPHDLIASGLERLLRQHAPGASLRRLTASCRSAGVDVAIVDQAAGASESYALAAAVPTVVLVRPPSASGAYRISAPDGAGTPKVLRTISIADPAAAIVGSLERTAALHPGVHPDAAYAALSERELEVMAGVAAGLSNAEMAGQLYLSINTIKTYIRTAYRKAGVARRSEATAWYLTHAAEGSRA